MPSLLMRSMKDSCSMAVDEGYLVLFLFDDDVGNNVACSSYSSGSSWFHDDR